MNNEAAAKLLAIVAAVDNRNTDLVSVQVWADALHGLDPDDCLQAIREHRRESTEYLTPAHVVARARQIMLDRRNRENAAALAIEAPIADPDSFAVKEVNRLLQEITPVIPKEDWPHPVIDDMQLPKKHACPACKAEVGIGCTNRGNGEALQGFHYTRLVRAGLAEPEKPFDPAELAKLIQQYPTQVGEQA
jgi:hypothetical protein